MLTLGIVNSIAGGKHNDKRILVYLMNFNSASFTILCYKVG